MKKLADISLFTSLGCSSKAESNIVGVFNTYTRDGLLNTIVAEICDSPLFRDSDGAATEGWSYRVKQGVRQYIKEELSSDSDKWDLIHDFCDDEYDDKFPSGVSSLDRLVEYVVLQDDYFQKHEVQSAVEDWYGKHTNDDGTFDDEAWRGASLYAPERPLD